MASQHSAFCNANQHLTCWNRINHDTLRDGWVLKFPSPKAGPADWASPAVLFGENEMTLPNGATELVPGTHPFKPVEVDLWSSERGSVSSTHVLLMPSGLLLCTCFSFLIVPLKHLSASNRTTSTDSRLNTACVAPPAGFVWNMSKRLLYYNDTAVSRIYVFDCDEAGLPVHNSRRVLREFNEDEGSPDVRWSDLMALGCHTYVT